MTVMFIACILFMNLVYGHSAFPILTPSTRIVSNIDDDIFQILMMASNQKNACDRLYCLAEHNRPLQCFRSMNQPRHWCLLPSADGNLVGVGDVDLRTVFLGEHDGAPHVHLPPYLVKLSNQFATSAPRLCPSKCKNSQKYHVAVFVATT